ncbi:myeloid-derived growth factor isoform X2 [Diceros bicornis minor]|uniref:myeloid-derived growth factor isoform X2 n=1 Tax=Diceros bicornis minor TaxID=77932 RepID=UPI0026EB9DF8|nr:myeloid-derived growth factor isoform X2 [Diceros bicornis minor]
MAAPSGGRSGGGASMWAALLLAAVALGPAEAASEPTTVAFDVQPGGVVHSFSQDVGPGGKYTCVFTYASQGGTNERWQMSLGTSEDNQHFTCTIWSYKPFSERTGGRVPSQNSSNPEGERARRTFWQRGKGGDVEGTPSSPEPAAP